MIRSSRGALALRGIVVAAAMAVIPAVAGCEAGANAPTQQWHQPTSGASTVFHKIAINNVFVLGAEPTSSLLAGQSAGLFLALTNSGAPDRLIGVSAPGTATAVQLPAGGIRVGSNQSVLLQGPHPQLILHQLTRPLRGGQDIPVTLSFQNAGSKTLQVPVMPWAQYYGTLSPVPVTPTASPAVTGTHSPTSPPSPTASPSPTG
ncbi:MAG: copper chaperone PCu(A)C [Actinobacteria bacterium]|nr:copper chaperone PCu(A)C [Actinomycetota bacterium]MBO0785695.1 copper chaperone PCu(A)C [Actinomycetota bacterium]MBO0814848.1 copper chaperone PCu(A)C [Actinomycetota bacterium]